MKNSFDTSFEREGRPLSEWLLDAVDGDSTRRDKALDVLWAMHAGRPTHDSETGEAPPGHYEQQTARFRAEVERAVTNPAFPGAHVVRALAALILGTHAEYLRQQKLSNERFDRIIDKLVEAQDKKTDVPPGRKKRLAGALCADTKQSEASMGALMNAVRVGIIFQNLGAGVLLAPDAVRALMADRNSSHFGFDALTGAGPKAADEFLPDLLAIKDPSRDSSIMKALASVGASDPRMVQSACDEILAAMADVSPGDQILHEDSEAFHRAFYGPHSGWNAASKLHQMGAAARLAPDVGPTVVPLLLKLSYSRRPGQRAAAAMALGVCARGDTPEEVHTVVNRLLELTKDQSWVVGRAIDALGELGADPARVVPRLIELLNEYVEFDCDEGYNGEHSRIRRALEAFGPAAREAIPVLIAKLKESATAKYSEFPDGIFETLHALKADPAELTAILNRMRSSGNHFSKDNKQQWQQDIDEALAKLRQT